MCLVFINFQPGSNGPLSIGANREESRRRPDHVARLLQATSDCAPCSPAPIMARTARSPRWEPGSASIKPAWPSPSPIATTVSWRRPIKRAHADCWPFSLLDSDRPEHAAHVAQSALMQRGYGGCNFLIAAADTAFIVQAPGPTRVRVAPLDPGIHAMTNLDLDDDDDPRIHLVRTTLEPDNFLASAAPTLPRRPDRCRRRRTRDGLVELDPRRSRDRALPYRGRPQGARPTRNFDSI